jgi:hypothetical protein
MRGVQTGWLSGVIALCVVAGCAKEPVPVAYAPRVTVADFAGELPMPQDGYQMLVQEPTTGRFTCGLAVARLRADSEDGAPVISVGALSPAEQAYWVETFRGVAALTDTSFLAPVTLKAEPEPLTALCRAAGTLGAKLLLVYVPGQIGPNSAEVLGVLYDVPTQRPLATLHRTMTIRNEEGVELPAVELVRDTKPRQELREHDAYYQTGRAFEQLTLQCVRELLQVDTPPSSTQPHRWHVDYRPPTIQP